jgi:arginyl-tRNA synthetase
MKGDKLVGKYYVEFDKEQKRQIAELVKSGVAEDKAGAQTSIMQLAQEMLRKWEAKDD